MGNKRVGLARTQALIENLRRELQMNNSTLGGVNRSVITLTAGDSVSENESGAVFFVTQASGTVTLPDPQDVSGATFTFVVKTAAAAHLDFDSQLAGGIIGVVVAADGKAPVGNQKLRVVSGTAAVGDRFTLMSDGNFYYLLDANADANGGLIGEGAT